LSGLAEIVGWNSRHPRGPLAGVELEQVWVGARDNVGEEEAFFVSEQGLSGRIFYCPTMPDAFYSQPYPKWVEKDGVCHKCYLYYKEQMHPK